MTMTQIFTHFASQADVCAGKGFLGLEPWYHYLPDDRFDGCDIKKFTILPSDSTPSDVPLVLLAIVDDLLRIAAFVALGFILYGAFLYVGSQGSPDQTARAQSTIINAVLGLALAIASIGFVSFLGARLG